MALNSLQHFPDLGFNESDDAIIMASKSGLSSLRTFLSFSWHKRFSKQPSHCGLLKTTLVWALIANNSKASLMTPYFIIELVG